MNRLRYVEQELAKKRGRNIDIENEVEKDVKRAEDELYKIPEHLKVSVLALFLSLSPRHTLAQIHTKNTRNVEREPQPHL